MQVIRKAVCVAALGLLLPQAAMSSDFMTFGGVSRHYDRSLDLNEFNPGIGYERDVDKDWSWSAGVFKNSLKRAAFYATANYALWKPAESWRVGATAGLSSGYHHAAIIPLVTPFIEWRGDKLAIQSYLIPTVHPYVDGAIVLQFKWRLD